MVTTALVFIGLCQLGAALLQWNAMNGQLAEMQSGSLDTTKIANATADFAKAMKDEAANTGNLVGATRKSADAAVQSAQASSEQLIPTVYPSAIDVRNVSAGEKPNIKIRLQNSGTTTAHNYAAWTVTALCEYPLTSPITYSRGPTGFPSELPSAQFRDINTTFALPFDQLDIDGLMNKREAIYVFGETTYTDARGNRIRKPFKLIYGGKQGATPDGTFYPEDYAVAQVPLGPVQKGCKK